MLSYRLLRPLCLQSFKKAYMCAEYILLLSYHHLDNLKFLDPWKQNVNNCCQRTSVSSLFLILFLFCFVLLAGGLSVYWYSTLWFYSMIILYPFCSFFSSFLRVHSRTGWEGRVCVLWLFCLILYCYQCCWCLVSINVYLFAFQRAKALGFFLGFFIFFFAWKIDFVLYQYFNFINMIISYIFLILHAVTSIS